MGMFDMSEEQVREWREKCRELVRPLVGGEEVVAAAAFRQGGATANYVASKAQLGGAVYAGIKMLRKKKAGGLPYKVKVGRDYKLGDEAAVWVRGGIVAGTDRSGGMTALTIESPSEGEKVTLVGISVKDDPVSQNLMEVLQGTAPPTAGA